MKLIFLKTNLMKKKNRKICGIFTKEDFDLNDEFNKINRKLNESFDKKFINPLEVDLNEEEDIIDYNKIYNNNDFNKIKEEFNNNNNNDFNKIKEEFNNNNNNNNDFNKIKEELNNNNNNIDFNKIKEEFNNNNENLNNIIIIMKI